MITLRVDALWDFNKRITYTMLGGFFVTYSAVVAFFIVAMIDLYSTCKRVIIPAVCLRLTVA